MITIKTKVAFTRSIAGRRRIVGQPAPQLPAGRIPRVSKQMALAIKFDRLLMEGTISDLTELARLGRVTQPRITQIMSLLHLAPGIQEELLFLPRISRGRDPIHEKMLRPLCAEVCWQKQRKLWRELKASAAMS